MPQYQNGGEKASPKIIKFPLHRVPWRNHVTPFILRDAARKLMDAKGIEATVEVLQRFGGDDPSLYVPKALQQQLYAALRNNAAGWKY